MSCKISHHRANLTRTFKTEYQPPTGGTTEQEIMERFPAFSLPPIKNFPSFFRINTQLFLFGNYKTKKCLLYSRNFAAYNKGKRERTGRFRTPAATKKGGIGKNLLRKKRRGRLARQGKGPAEKEHSFLPVTRAQYCAYFTSDKIGIMMNLSGGHHPRRRYRRHLL